MKSQKKKTSFPQPGSFTSDSLALFSHASPLVYKADNERTLPRRLRRFRGIKFFSFEDLGEKKPHPSVVRKLSEPRWLGPIVINSNRLAARRERRAASPLERRTPDSGRRTGGANKLKANNGYIAITSAIIISVLLMTISFTLSLSSFFNRSNILDSTFKEISYALAEACVDTALLKLAQNGSYAGNENVTIDGDTCAILPVESPSGQKIIKTQANFRGAFTNMKVTVTSPTISIVFWEELPSF